ncbi:MAG TPA: hypothetical protein VN903_22325 [Polyangia bacterium]|jgi:hypothetical protein|nr:hypothetical protein [Polyangia bacterium]
MKTRHLTAILIVAGAAGFALAACSTDTSNLDPNVAARLRNNLPSACTAETIAACPALEVAQCPNGQEPVIDYSADCCPHFTCQPLCQTPQARTCPMTPAPVCPAHTKLWIGTAVEDCCPAYRCEPDGTMCDPANGEKCGCDATNVACTLALPYCGPNVQPIVVGETADCCPIYQCPCAVVVDATTGMTTNGPNCGCTTPNCKMGEEVVCDKKDVCGGPCTCQPARGVCKADTDCAADARCDLTNCRLPPVAAAPNAPTCDPTKCGPQLGLPTIMCTDGSVGGSTGRCLLNADGSCGWEIRPCPTDCYGICVPNIQRGCKADTDCPTGQQCNIACTGWGCSAGGTPTTTDPSTGMTVPPDATCGCTAADPSCMCDATGNCKGQICEGTCAPKPPTCDPKNPVACPTFAPVCPNGVTPIPNGVDPMTCCQTYTCPVCAAATTSTGAASVCPAIRCACAKVIATDPATCCPKYECGAVNADGTCAK